MSSLIKFENCEFNEHEYIEFLRLLASESKFLQNGGDHVAQETLAANHVIARLQPYINMGLIKCTKYEYVEGRANLIIEYGDMSEDCKTLTFAGSHFDVVPADPSAWDFDPFQLSVEGDKLRFRGSTDCLGHVALTTILLEELAKNNVQLKYRFVVVFIADEEVGKNPDVGVLHLDRDGHLDHIKGGSVYWIDASDAEPVLATGSAIAWELKVTGKKAHTGFLHHGVNPLPIAMEATKAIVQEFNRLCPRSEKDDEYNFKAHSNMKPTIWSMPEGSSANQFSDWCKVTGDVRMTPFLDPFTVKDQICKFVENLRVEDLPKWHDHFDTSCGKGDEKVTAKLEFKWVFGPYCGVAVSKESKGWDMIVKATEQFHGSCKGCSDLGALPLVREMKDAGIDIQIIGYGVTKAYHANNEYCTISGMRKGFNILKTLLEIANE